MSTQTETVRNTTRGCRLRDVKNISGCKNSSPTEVKRAFILLNLSIFKNQNVCEIPLKQKLSTKPAHQHLSFGTFSY
jgi:hypothetical protein